LKRLKLIEREYLDAEKEVADEVPVKPEMKDIDKDVKLKVAEENVATKEVAEDMKTMEVVKPDMSLKKLEKKEVIKDSKLKKVVKEEVAVKAPKASVKTETKPKTVKTTEKKEVSPEKEKQIEGLIKKYAKKETSETASTNVHVVKRGETLWSISRLHKLTVDELKKLNELKTNILSVGQELKVK